MIRKTVLDIVSHWRAENRLTATSDRGGAFNWNSEVPSYSYQTKSGEGEQVAATSSLTESHRIFMDLESTKGKQDLDSSAQFQLESNPDGTPLRKVGLERSHKEILPGASGSGGVVKDNQHDTRDAPGQLKSKSDMKLNGSSQKPGSNPDTTVLNHCQTEETGLPALMNQDDDWGDMVDGISLSEAQENAKPQVDVDLPLPVWSSTEPNMSSGLSMPSTKDQRSSPNYNLGPQLPAPFFSDLRHDAAVRSYLIKKATGVAPTPQPYEKKVQFDPAFQSTVSSDEIPTTGEPVITSEAQASSSVSIGFVKPNTGSDLLISDEAKAIIDGLSSFSFMFKA